MGRTEGRATSITPAIAWPRRSDHLIASGTRAAPTRPSGKRRYHPRRRSLGRKSDSGAGLPNPRGSNDRQALQGYRSTWLSGSLGSAGNDAAEIPQLRHRVRRRRALPVRAPRACWLRGLHAPARVQAAAPLCRRESVPEGRFWGESRWARIRCIGGARQWRPCARADNEAGARCVRLRRGVLCLP